MELIFAAIIALVALVVGVFAPFVGTAPASPPPARVLAAAKYTSNGIEGVEVGQKCSGTTITAKNGLNGVSVANLTTFVFDSGTRIPSQSAFFDVMSHGRTSKTHNPGKNQTFLYDVNNPNRVFASYTRSSCPKKGLRLFAKTGLLKAGAQTWKTSFEARNTARSAKKFTAWRFNRLTETSRLVWSDDVPPGKTKGGSTTLSIDEDLDLCRGTSWCGKEGKPAALLYRVQFVDNGKGELIAKR